MRHGFKYYYGFIYISESVCIIFDSVWGQKAPTINSKLNVIFNHSTVLCYTTVPPWKKRHAESNSIIFVLKRHQEKTVVINKKKGGVDTR